jgi:sulfonate transport system substrate-binding protein
VTGSRKLTIALPTGTVKMTVGVRIMKAIRSVLLAALVLSAFALEAMAADMKLGYQAAVPSAPTVVALETGVFARHGLNVQPLRFDSGKTIRDAMVGRSIDVGAMGLTPAVVGIAKGEMICIGVLNLYARTVMVMVPADSKITSVAELRGKRVAMHVGTTAANVFVAQIAPAYGLKRGDYQVVNVPDTEQGAALAAKAVDATTANDPYASLAEYNKVGRVIESFAKYNLFPNLIVVRSSYVDEQPDALVAYMKAMTDTVRLFRERPDTVVDIVAAFYKKQGYELPREVVQKMVSHLDLDLAVTPQVRTLLEDEARVLKEQGNISQIPDWSKRIRVDFLQRATR